MSEIDPMRTVTLDGDPERTRRRRALGGAVALLVTLLTVLT